MNRDWAGRKADSDQVKEILRDIGHQLVDLIAERPGGAKGLAEANKMLFVASKHVRGKVPWERKSEIHAEYMEQIESQFAAIIDEYRRDHPIE